MTHDPLADDTRDSHLEFKDIEWDDEFEPVVRRSFRWDLIADQLRQRPGKWARVPNTNGYGVIAPMINRGNGPLAMRNGRWQAATRRGEVWIRYLGEK